MLRTPMDLMQPWTRLGQVMLSGMLQAQANMLRGLPMQPPALDASAAKGPSTVILSPVTFIISIR